MGVDISGKTNGTYFRRSWWGWRPIPAYIEYVAPDLYSKCEHWGTNDGDGLNENESHQLAEIIQNSITNGTAIEYIEERNRLLESLPNTICNICEGTGYRMPPPITGAGDQECNGCRGEGSHRPSDTWYVLEVEDLQEFAQFLEECDGFEIW